MPEIPFPNTWHVRNPVNHGIFTISTGAGFFAINSITGGGSAKKTLEKLAPIKLGATQLTGKNIVDTEGLL